MIKMVYCKFFGSPKYNQVILVKHFVHHKNLVQFKLLDQFHDKFLKPTLDIQLKTINKFDQDGLFVANFGVWV
jgi:hypothetical protein